MIKIAIVSELLSDTEEIHKLLAKHYIIEKTITGKSDTFFTQTITIIDSPGQAIDLLCTATGIDPRKRSKRRGAICVACAACYLLRYRFHLSHEMIAKRLHYVNRISSIIHCKHMPEIDVDRKTVPIELAIERVFEKAKKYPPTDNRGQGQRK